MGVSNHTQDVRGKSEVTSVSTSKDLAKRCSINSGPNSIGHRILKSVSTLNNAKLGRCTSGQAASFLLKIALLEIVRRLSRARCPVVWSGLQALQLFCYQPFKWIQRWKPFGILVEGLQMLSRPLLVLVVATAFSEDEGTKGSNHVSGSSEDSGDIGDPNSVSESHPESSSMLATSDTRTGGEGSKTFSFPNWLIQLHEELKNQGVTVPERINDEELCRFYTAANGEFSCLLSSVKKTIYWRESYRILSGQELEMWSSMVFWHGFDFHHRPCLFVRLGLACASLLSDQRPRFAQAVVSQVEYGVLHLVDKENPQINVLVDCEGLSPSKIPMHMMKSCSTLLQDHFPNRLGCLFIIRLPPVARVALQTFLQILKPITRKKLKIEGDMYEKILSECLQTLPSYLGGACTCTGCVRRSMCSTRHSFPIVADGTESSVDLYSNADLPLPNPISQLDMFMNVNFNQVIRIGVISILIFSVLVAFIAGLYDPECRPGLSVSGGSIPA